MPELIESQARADASSSGFEVRCARRAEFAAITDRLVAELASQLPADVVVRHVAQAREDLLAAGVRSELGVAVEAMARARLDHLLPAHAVPG